MSDSVQSHRQQPTRLPRPWDSPGKNTGVDCHFLLQCMKVKSESEVAQSCPTLRNPMDCSLSGSYVHGISQARVLEWVAIAFSASGPYKMLFDLIHVSQGFPHRLVDKESTCNAGDPGLISESNDSLEKGVATHSSILAWRIPWTEEPCGLQSMGPQSIG